MAMIDAPFCSECKYRVPMFGYEKKRTACFYFSEYNADMDKMEWYYVRDNDFCSNGRYGAPHYTYCAVVDDDGEILKDGVVEL